MGNYQKLLDIQPDVETSNSISEFEREVIECVTTANRNQSRIDELFVGWSVARAEANIAYDQWVKRSGSKLYANYRACEDRADRAQDLLADAVRF